MMSKGVWTACLAASLVIHIAILGADFRHRTAHTGKVIAIPMNLSVPVADTPAAGMSLHAAASEPGAENGEGDHESPEARRKRILTHYLGQIRREVERMKFQSAQGDFRRMIGNARIALAIRADGSFCDVHLARSSGDTRLDDTALAAVCSASARIPRPVATGTSELHTSITVKYQYGL
ncbi:TonB family protein [Desulfobaculum xiamenense]|uniref:TonB family protein n=1 Tax=Desulfobaculum xiamenense TaxID=995050 RepID=A0A846QMJ6_9BACT|nr:TonB family protein [Desulfobaculum xiamenense]NJB66474.1 TonB family protein [Desulfobaculum xiamenense]